LVPHYEYELTFSVYPVFTLYRRRILPQEQTEGLWDAGDWGPLERFVTEEYIADTLWAFEPGFRRETTIPAADQMGTLPLPADHPERCQFLVAETLFGEMLALPRPAHEAVFYHIVIQDLCKAIPSFPKMMAKVVGQMFRQIGRMEFEARERLADWMAHHLSCFDLAWPWQSWVHVADQPSNHPQRTFCNSVVRRLCRLSYYDRVKESLPDELHCLVPNTPALNPDYILETLNGSSGALRDLQAFMKEKKPAGEVMEWFKTSGKLDALGRAGAAKALTVAALQHGQKCITHHNVLLKRYESALVELTKSDAEAGEDGCADVMVAAAAGVWAGAHPHMAVTAVSRLLELGLVTPNDVATWVQKSIDDETAAGDRRGRRITRRRVGNRRRLGHRVPRRGNSRGGSRGPRVESKFGEAEGGRG
jgi:nuclear cap-binding protein subunit 1